MALFSKADLDKSKYMVAIVEDIKSKKPIRIQDNGSIKPFVIEYTKTIKDIEKVYTEPAKYKKYLYPNGKYAAVFVSKGNYFTFNKIDKAPYSKMGGSANALGKKLADAGEKATIAAIELYAAGKTVDKPADTKEQIFIDNPDIFNKWKKTFDVTPKILSKLLKYNIKDYDFIHDATRNNAFSPIVDMFVKTRGGSKDSWNPADVWCVKRGSLQTIKTEMSRIFSQKLPKESIIKEGNSYIIDLYNSGLLYPISLKQIIGTGSSELSNYDTHACTYSFEMTKFPHDFVMNADGSFKSKEIGLFNAINTDTNAAMTFQVRGFPHGLTTAQTEITSSGEKTGGRVGKVPTSEIDRILGSYGEARIRSIKELKGFDWTQTVIKQYSDMYRNVSGSAKYFEDNIDSWLARAQNDPKFAADFCIKIQGLVISDILCRHKKDLSSILTGFLLAAKKMSTDSGFFIKIY